MLNVSPECRSALGIGGLSAAGDSISSSARLLQFAPRLALRSLLANDIRCGRVRPLEGEAMDAGVSNSLSSFASATPPNTLDGVLTPRDFGVAILHYRTRRTAEMESMTTVRGSQSTHIVLANS